MNLMYIVLVVLGFVAVVMMLEGLFLLWSNHRSPEVMHIEHRLRMVATADAGLHLSQLAKQRMLSASPRIHDWLTKIKIFRQLDQLLVQAGSKLNTSSCLAICCSCAAGAGSLALLLDWAWWAGLPGMLLAALVPVMRLYAMRSARIEKIGAQLPGALDLISRAVRAGHAFSMTLGMVGDESAEPIASEFKTTFDEIRFGIATRTALLNLAERVPLSDMRYFVLAVVIQLETGGNLTELLGILSRLIRERFSLMGKIKVLATEGKLSAYIMTALPFVVAGVLQLVNPQYMRSLYQDPAGLQILIGALLMMGVGVLWMFRLTKIRI